MRAQIKELVNGKLSQNDNLNRVREYIQAYFLYLSYKKKFYQNLIFTGGTALRFIYRIQRFSEDLDFSLSAKAKNYDFTEMLKNVKREFELSGYDIEIKSSIEKNVHSAFLKFPGILFESGLSPLKGEKISIKIEVDTNPPAGGIEENTLYNAAFMFYVVHYDLASLFAGKLHAVLSRKYTKGRDWYDLLWYLSKFKGLEPNFALLNNALAQTQKTPSTLSKANWKEKIKDVIEKVDMASVKNDVRRFLENHSDIELLTKENLLNLI